MKTLTMSLLTLAVAGINSLHGAVLFDLSNPVLAGSPGANTFLDTNGQAASLSYSSSTPSLTWTEGSGGNFTYFLSYFNASTLVSVGDSISLSYTMAPSAANAFYTVNDQNLRIGLFNSAGSRIIADQTGTGSATFNNYTGYMATYRPIGTPVGTANTFYQRDKSNSGLLSGGGFTQLAGPTLASPGSSTITGSLTLSLVPTGLQITSTTPGGTQSFIDTTGLATTFDTLAFFNYSGAPAPTLTFTNLSVAAIPEPSTWAVALVGLTSLAMIRRWRLTGVGQ